MNEINIILSSITLNKALEVPLYIQLADSICELIENGSLKTNEKLPSIRMFSKLLNVNNVTIVNAYKQLENKKIVYTLVGSGTFISDLSFEIKPIIDKNIVNSRIDNALMYKQNLIDVNLKNNKNGLINFTKSSISSDLFPVDDFKNIFSKILERDKGEAFGYEEIQGFKPLRNAISNLVLKVGIKAEIDRIQIISGAQQGIDLISKAILSFGDNIIVESPTYYGAVGAFLSRGVKLIEAPLEKDGFDLKKLQNLIKLYRPKLIYTMPYFQTPTCINISIEKKRKLIELAIKYDFYILEEDNQSEFNYTTDKIVPLKALDYKNKVIYIKSFSKILMPGLRLGFIILPRNVLEKVISAKYTSDMDTSGFLQRGFEMFLNSNKWNIHLNKMIKIYKEKYFIVEKYSNIYLKEFFDFTPPNGGLNFCFYFKKKIDLVSFTNLILMAGVIVSPGTIFSLNLNEHEFIRLSFADIENEKIIDGIKIIAKTMLEIKEKMN